MTRQLFATAPKRIPPIGSPEYIAMMAKADEAAEQLYRERVAKRLARESAKKTKGKS